MLHNWSETSDGYYSFSKEP